LTDTNNQQATSNKQQATSNTNTNTNTNTNNTTNNNTFLRHLSTPPFHATLARLLLDY